MLQAEEKLDRQMIEENKRVQAVWTREDETRKLLEKPRSGTGRLALNARIPSLL